MMNWQRWLHGAPKGSRMILSHDAGVYRQLAAEARAQAQFYAQQCQQIQLNHTCAGEQQRALVLAEIAKTYDQLANCSFEES
jgi:hypothetical protein